ncbi:MAG: L-fucose/L-arabinose isomerase family protein [Deinococcota bacterium]
MRGVQAKIGIFGIGLAAYWPQFEGLKQRLEGYQKHIETRLDEFGGEVISAGLVDDAPGAKAAGDLFAAENVDLIICYVGTYATSSQVLPAVQRRKAPVLILNLQPTPALDYLHTDTAEWLANCCACCVPEIANAFARANIQFNVVTGLLSEASGAANRYHTRAWQEIADWVSAASVLRAMHYSRIGFLGHTYPGMLDMYSDPTMVHAQLGSHVELLEMDDLQVRVEAASQADIDTKVAEIKDVFTIAQAGFDKLSQDVSPQALEWSAQVAVGLDQLASDFDLHGLTYYYRGLNGNIFEELGASVIVGNSLLTARGIAAAGEGDLKTCLAMMILDRFGAGGSYTEFYALDFNEDFILMGHDGPGHIAISDEKPVLRGLGLYHGKRGYGISVEFKVKTGPVTILGMTQTADGQLKLLAAEAESISGDTLQIGNTNSRLKFASEPDAFFNAWCAEGPTHHVALGVSHQLSKLRKFSRLSGLELVEVS